MRYRFELVPGNRNILRVCVDQPLIRNPRQPFFISAKQGSIAESKIEKESPCSENLLSFVRTVSKLKGVNGQIGFHEGWIDLGRDGSISPEELAGHVEIALRFLAKDEELKPMEKGTSAPRRLRFG
jgi:hypothetical protein